MYAEKALKKQKENISFSRLDLEYDPDDMKKLMTILDNKADVV